MTEFEQGVIEVIAQNSLYGEEEIELTAKLEKYISSGSGDRLARRIGARFERIDSTDLTHKLYTTITTVSQLVEYVSSSYI